jgi:cell fate regulator YaaT (PSP1 superfamily)
VDGSENAEGAGGSPASPDAAAGAEGGGETASRRPTVIVRYGAMGNLARFAHNMEQLRCGQRVIIKSDRGMEVGTTVCQWEGCGAPRGVSGQIKGEVLRPLTHVDEIEERHLQETADREFAFCKKTVAERGMPMKMVAVEHLFGGDRVIFYFVSEQRVDFRSLVRDLAHEFQTRIEMRQIGVRDEARLLGDYERCGRPLCCRAWIKDLEPVSMKMAKVQKATLDPTKISGRCGRLMCCLRFEHATYRDLAKNLPRKNTEVMTAQGRGKVVDTDIVSQMVAVLLVTGTRINVPVESLLPPDAAPPPGTEAPAAPAAPADRPPRHERRERTPREERQKLRDTVGPKPAGQEDRAPAAEAPSAGEPPPSEAEGEPSEPVPPPSRGPGEGKAPGEGKPAGEGASDGAGKPEGEDARRSHRRRGRRRRGGRNRNRSPNDPKGPPRGGPGPAGGTA